LGSCGPRQKVTRMVRDRLDDVKVCFDDERAVSNAGVLLVATLAQRLGLEAVRRWSASACIWARAGRGFGRDARS
jgi:hypothetical protein